MNPLTYLINYELTVIQWNRKTCINWSLSTKTITKAPAHHIYHYQLTSSHFPGLLTSTLESSPTSAAQLPRRLIRKLLLSRIPLSLPLSLHRSHSSHHQLQMCQSMPQLQQFFHNLWLESQHHLCCPSRRVDQPRAGRALLVKAKAIINAEQRPLQRSLIEAFPDAQIFFSCFSLPLCVFAWGYLCVSVLLLTNPTYTWLYNYPMFLSPRYLHILDK